MRGRERHGWRDRAYRDVFTGPPQPAPPRRLTGNPLLLRPLPSQLLLRVQGCKPCRTPPTFPTCGGHARPLAFGRRSPPKDRP
ncbi:hypothetical protein D7U74_16350 [Stenotrophomonas maltophilia]|nr:hypothetical protein [Stenotrophomonas maltophilia]